MSWVWKLPAKDAAIMALRLRHPKPDTVQTCILRILKGDASKEGREALIRLRSMITKDVLSSKAITDELMSACTATDEYKSEGLQLKIQLGKVSGIVTEEEHVTDTRGIIKVKKVIVSTHEKNMWRVLKDLSTDQAKTLASKQLISMLEFPSCSPMKKRVISSELLQRGASFPLTVQFLCNGLYPNFSTKATSAVASAVDFDALTLLELQQLSEHCEQGFNQSLWKVFEVNHLNVYSNLSGDLLSQFTKRLRNDECSVEMAASLICRMVKAHASRDLQSLRDWAYVYSEQLSDLSSFIFMSLSSINDDERLPVLIDWVSVLGLSNVRPHEHRFFVKMLNGVFSLPPSGLPPPPGVSTTSLIVSVAECRPDYDYSHLVEEMCLRFAPQSTTAPLVVSFLYNSGFEKLSNSLFAKMLRTTEFEVLHKFYRVFPLEMQLQISETFGIAGEVIAYYGNPPLSPAVLELTLYNASRGLL
eukprot:TRINITY_DN27833_c0_g1_i1.p1 TRINITY_DN27833_c0_g1~~TRINITY_DN27833_c0_g1_i1.p1  ORF type:complete len:474 (+),score=67.92 TRINITY_DN27833_c0_g1_i1:50-1471(+)